MPPIWSHCLFVSGLSPFVINPECVKFTLTGESPLDNPHSGI